MVVVRGLGLQLLLAHGVQGKGHVRRGDGGRHDTETDTEPLHSQCAELVSWDWLLLGFGLTEQSDVQFITVYPTRHIPSLVVEGEHRQVHVLDADIHVVVSLTVKLGQFQIDILG